MMNRRLGGGGVFLRIALGAVMMAGLGMGVAAAGLGDLEESIQKVRMGTISVETTPGAEVKVEQLRHEFWFGAALASHVFSGDLPEAEARKYQEVCLENVNSAVTENALKWHAMEPRRGEVDYSVVEAMLTWTEEHRIPLRGHNIFWGFRAGFRAGRRRWTTGHCVKW